MRVLALEYHDIVANGAWEATGFGGLAARSYKLSNDSFDDHLRAIRTAAPEITANVVAAVGDKCAAPSTPVLLTFDDGGVSAYTEIAPRLERYGWRGHFFIPTDFIGTPGFLTTDQLRELHQGGHCVGAHSCSHPLRMSDLSNQRLEQEWRASVERLSDVLGAPVLVGSLPGGALSRPVADAAAAAGLRTLFTSEPVPRSWQVGACALFGRFTVRETTSAAAIGAVVSGARRPWLQQWARWNALKLAKAATGPAYLTMRNKLLRDGPS